MENNIENQSEAAQTPEISNNQNGNTENPTKQPTSNKDHEDTNKSNESTFKTFLYEYKKTNKHHDRLVNWTTVLAISTILVFIFTALLAKYTYNLFRSTKSELSEIRERENVEMIQKLSTELYSYKYTNELIMLAEKDLLEFQENPDTVLGFPHNFPVFKANFEKYPSIKQFLLDTTGKKKYYSTYEMDDFLGPLDRAGGYFRNNMIKFYDLNIFFYWPAVMLGKNKAINLYLRWSLNEYTKRKNNNHIPYGMHYYDLRCMMDSLIHFDLSQDSSFNEKNDTSKVLEWLPLILRNQPDSIGYK